MTLKIDEIDPYVCLQLLKKIDLQDLCFASCIYSLLIPKIQVLFVSAPKIIKCLNLHSVFNYI